jgi:hypothetical protein
MKNIIETTHFVYFIDIQQDTYPSNPRIEWANLGTLCIPHNRYLLSDKDTPTSIDELKYLLGVETDKNEYEYYGIEPKSFKGVYVPISLYIHSDICIRSGGINGADGYAYVSKETLLKEYGGKILTAKLKAKAVAMLEGEIKTFNQYLTGDVWGYQIYRVYKNEYPNFSEFGEDEYKELGENLDSCWGYYYDSPNKMLEDMESEFRIMIENDNAINEKYEIVKIQKAVYNAQIATLQLSFPFDEIARRQNTDIYIETL